MQFLLVALLSPFLAVQDSIPQDLRSYGKNKTIPETIERQALVALSHYPDLKNTDIRFIFREDLKRTVMAARPVMGTLLRKRENRAYQILINPVFKLDEHFESMDQIPDSVMIGWLGHELGHIVDYERRSSLDLVGFGISYTLSKRFIRRAERTADAFAVEHGMGAYSAATKTFILHHALLPQPYKDRIASLYLAPDEILQLVDELDDEDDVEKVKTLAEEEERTREAEAISKKRNKKSKPN